jgi:hypothetical protein
MRLVDPDFRIFCDYEYFLRCIGNGESCLWPFIQVFGGLRSTTQVYRAISIGQWGARTALPLWNG